MRGRLWAAAALARFALDGGEEPETRRPVSRLRRRRRRIGSVFRSATNSPITSPSARITCTSRIRSCDPAPSDRSCAPARPPVHMEGMSRIHRADRIFGSVRSSPAKSNMCHTLANLEYHHFKYAAHRRPGDVHLHFFGTATLSFADGDRLRYPATSSKSNCRNWARRCTIRWRASPKISAWAASGRSDR